MADGRLTDEGASQSIADAINTVSGRTSGTTQQSLKAIVGFLRYAQENIAAVIQSDVAREMAQKAGDGLKSAGEGMSNAKDTILEMDRAGREKFAEYFPQSQPSLPPKATGQEIPTIESTPAETLKSMAEAAVPRVQQASKVLFDGASTLKDNLQSSWKEMAAQVLSPEALKPELEKVPVTIRVNGTNAFEGSLAGGQLMDLNDKQNAMIQRALTNPESVQGSVKMSVANKPVYLLSQGTVLRDQLKLSSQPVQQQAVEQKKTVAAAAVPSSSPQKSVEAKPTPSSQQKVTTAVQSGNWQEALFAQVSAISNDLGSIHAKISNLEAQLDGNSKDLNDLFEDHEAIEGKIDNLTDQLRPATKSAKPTVRQWLNTTRATLKTQVLQKLQQFKQFVSQKVQQISGKFEQANVALKNKAQTAEATVKAAPYKGTQAFMTKVGEPAIRFLLSHSTQPDQAGNYNLDTNNYQYSMDTKGNVAMKAKDGRGTLKPSNMNQKDLKTVSAISQQVVKQQQQQQQQAAKPTTGLKR